jgi:hypothetical protein
MRRLVLFVAFAILLGAPSQSQSQSARSTPSGWTETATSAAAVKAGITLPLSAGTLRKTELGQYDKDGADLSARYMSSDRAIQGTIFLSEPTFADTGLAFLATDEVIRRQRGPATAITADRLLPVAGVRAAERRVVYASALDQQRSLVTIVSFVRAGSWLVIVQVTGPAEQAQEINRDLDALLAGMTFAKGSEPRPATVIKTERCAPRDRTIAAKVTRPQTGDGLEFLSESAALTGKVPTRLCLESLEVIGDVGLQIYRPSEAPDRPYLTRLYALLGNSGVILEVAESRKEPGAFYVLSHGVGRATVFGKFDREPSIGQIRALAAAPDEQPAAILLFSTSALSPEMSGVAPGRGVTIKVYCDWGLNACVAPEEAKPKPQSSR